MERNRKETGGIPNGNLADIELKSDGNMKET